MTRAPKRIVLSKRLTDAQLAEVRGGGVGTSPSVTPPEPEVK